MPSPYGPITFGRGAENHHSQWTPTPLHPEQGPLEIQSVAEPCADSQRSWNAPPTQEFTNFPVPSRTSCHHLPTHLWAAWCAKRPDGEMMVCALNLATTSELILKPVKWFESDVSHKALTVSLFSQVFWPHSSVTPFSSWASPGFPDPDPFLCSPSPLLFTEGWDALSPWVTALCPQGLFHLPQS